MNMKFMSLEETKSETKVHKNIYLFDFFFILIYSAVSGMFGTVVSESIRIPYYIYSVFWRHMAYSQKQDKQKKKEL